MAENLIKSIKGKGIPLVLIHGWGLNSGIWQLLINKMIENSFVDDSGDKFQIITIDLPGFGLNSKQVLTSYSVSNICQKIDAIIEEPAVFMGWSLGGLVATHFALHYPKKILGLITVASSPCFLKKDSWPGIKADFFTAFHQQLKGNIYKTIDDFLKLQAMGSPHVRQDIKQIKKLIFDYPLPNEKTLDESLNLLENIDLRKQLIEIKQPFLRLYGSADNLVPKAAIEHIASLSPNSEQHIFLHASHAPFISHLNYFYDVLVFWLNKKFTVK